MEFYRRALFLLSLFLVVFSFAAVAATNEVVIVELQGSVQVAAPGSDEWKTGVIKQNLSPGNRVRTGPNSRVTLRWSSESVVSFGASSEVEILPPLNGQSGLQLNRGVLSFFNRDKPGKIRVITRGATAGIEGTEFVLSVSDDGKTTMSVIEGKVTFSNEHASIVLTSGEQAVAEPGQAPVRTAGFIANHLLQWCFYYPAVLDLHDLNLNDEENNALADSIAAYHSGDLLSALARYPEGREPSSDAERVFRAALLLSVGQVDQTEAVLAELPIDAESAQRLAAALRLLIAAVKRTPHVPLTNPELPTELLAASYYEQARAVRGDSLEMALEFARAATLRSPEFGFAWTRLAELEFSFGETKKANAVLERGLALSARNAQALALKGFLFAAEDETAEAIRWFDRALEIDSSLANAWLGRGLCRIRRGEVAGGREDLLVAAALEPQRAELRSYLGKAHETAGDYEHAQKELEIAARLDPHHPTPWLYSALIHQQNNQVNDAIRDLEKSQQLNDNRSVYRSQLMLNQDHAVRSANLARIYVDAGMADVSLREASRAVSYDYANYSAHLFLANSYEAMRDPNRLNLRYESPAFTEYLLANLLAPVDAGPLSPAISQNEYSRLFHQNHFGFISGTEYLSRGAWSQTFAQYGTLDSFNYSLEGIYRTDNGQRINNDFELKQLGLFLKQRITPQDHLMLGVNSLRFETGDVNQRYHPDDARKDYRSSEEQVPNVMLGYHHEWSPGIHTLLLLGRQVADLEGSSTNVPGLISFSDNGHLTGVTPTTKTLDFRIEQELYSAELQQIFQTADFTTVFGGLYQYEPMRIRDYETTADDKWWLVNNPELRVIANERMDVTHERVSLYGYHSHQVLDSLLLVGGLTYDQILFPENWNSAPVSEDQARRSQLSPKAGFIWTPARGLTIRGAYTRSLSGTSFDQSFRIEPSQVARINQTFRSLISESLKGATSGAHFDTYGLSLEQKFDTGTYLGLSGEMLCSQLDRKIGTHVLLDWQAEGPELTDFRLSEELESRERSLVFTFDQLLGSEWAVGARYRLTLAELNTHIKNEFPDDDLIDVPLRENDESLLHQLDLHLNFNHVSGIFGSLEAMWFRQENTEDLANQPGDDFWQFNALGGYRFWQRRARLEVGLLNIFDQDYRLHPLVWHDDLPRGRTIVGRFQLSF